MNNIPQTVNNVEQVVRFSDLRQPVSFEPWVVSEIYEAKAEGEADTFDAFLSYLSGKYRGLELEDYQKHMAQDKLGLQSGFDLSELDF